MTRQDGDVAETPVLALDGLTKSFGSVRALDEVSLRIRRGDVVGLVGDNGAGKSTLIKCIGGVHSPDRGRIFIDGEQERLTAEGARQLGIESVHQSLGLVDTLEVWENFFLNREILRRGWLASTLRIINRRAMHTKTRDALRAFDVDVGSVDREISKLSGGQRQIVAVIRAIHAGPRLVMMDEPTASLGVEQSSLVLGLVKTLPEKSITAVFVSHNMQHVFEVSTRIVVLRRGQKVADVPTSETSPHEIVSYITGSDQVSSGFA